MASVIFSTVAPSYEDTSPPYEFYCSFSWISLFANGVTVGDAVFVAVMYEPVGSIPYPPPYEVSGWEVYGQRVVVGSGGEGGSPNNRCTLYRHIVTGDEGGGPRFPTGISVGVGQVFAIRGLNNAAALIGSNGGTKVNDFTPGNEHAYADSGALTVGTADDFVLNVAWFYSYSPGAPMLPPSFAGGNQVLAGTQANPAPNGAYGCGYVGAFQYGGTSQPSNRATVYSTPTGSVYNGGMAASFGLTAIPTPIGGSLIKTLAPLTVSGAAKNTNHGTLTKTLGALSLSASGKYIGSGELAATLAPLTLSAAGTGGTILGQLGPVTLDPLTALGVAMAKIKGQLAATLGDVTTAPALTGVWATSTNSLRVVLTHEPLNSSAFGDGDALNPLTWTVTRADGFVYTVAGITMADETTVDIMVLEALGSHLVDHAITAPNLRAPNGSPALTVLSGAFVGTVQTLDPLQVVQLDRFNDRDLKNPPVFAETGGLGGTIQIGSDSDYDTEYGEALIRKLVIRRLMTPRAGFTWLRRYGVGFNLKEPLPTNDITALRAEIEEQIGLEPDVASVRASLLLDRSNILLVQLRIKPTGAGSAFDMQIRGGDGQLVEIQ